MFHWLSKRFSSFFSGKGEDDLQSRILAEFKRAKQVSQRGFPHKLVLPLYYGRALPERVVELLLARLIYKAGEKILDVAHANAMLCYRKMLSTLPEPRRFIGIDIAPPTYDTRSFYLESHAGDITKAGFENGAFDQIWCISALEHFGMDNSNYTRDFRFAEGQDAIAMKEMLRLLAPGGKLLITVPYGKFEDHGWLKNYDHAHWHALLQEARKAGSVREWYFRHTKRKGWKLVAPEELVDVGYYDQRNSGAGAIAAVLIEKKAIPS